MIVSDTYASEYLPLKHCPVLGTNVINKNLLYDQDVFSIYETITAYHITMDDLYSVYHNML